MIAPRLLPLWIKIVLRSRIKIQLAKNSTCSRAILDLLHSIFLNVANCTRCARAILQHLKKVSCNKSRIALERVLFYVLMLNDFENEPLNELLRSEFLRKNVSSILD